MKINFKGNYKLILEIIVGIIIISVSMFYAFYYSVDDLKNVKNAETTLLRQKKIRVALEEFYQKTGIYPNLVEEGVSNNLQLVATEGKDGKKVYFSLIYGKNKLDAPVAKDGEKESNKVYDVEDFKEATNNGGWNYNYTGNTGEIHANLPDNYYLQQIKWNEE